MDAPDERLQLLLREVSQQVKGSADAPLNELLALIPHLPGIRKSTHPDYPEALNQTLMQVYQNIQKNFQLKNESEPADVLRERFVRWVNSYLKYRILDLYRQENRPLSLDDFISVDSGQRFIDVLDDGGFQAPSLNSIDALIEKSQKEKNRESVLAFELYIEQDPLNQLRSCYPAGCPECNCQTLVQELFLVERGTEITLKEGNKRITANKAEKKVTIRALAEKLGIKEQTAHTHWKRKCRPLLREILTQIEESTTNLIES